MEKTQIIDGLTAVFRQILDAPDLVLRDDLTASQVTGWDSLNHVNLMVAVEERFKVKFTTREIRNLSNVGELIGLVEKKL